MRRRKRDLYHRLAKEKGYRSRAAFKLLQAVDRYHFIRSGDRVLDLGAAPGGWLQAARQTVGPSGYVLGVDKEPIARLKFGNVSTITLDIAQDNVAKEIMAASGEKFDVVLSDLSPNVSGVWEVDQARQIELARRALAIAKQVLRTSGNMLVKVFQGSDLKEFEEEFASSFRNYRIVKPQASRSESAELYLLGLSFHGSS